MAPLLVGIWLLTCTDVRGQVDNQQSATAISTSVLAHYMPWFEVRQQSPRWGWHWTMNAFDPEKQIDGHPQIASHYHPLIGPYDSSDSDVLEFHLLTMKLAGIDGVIVDWYGLTDYRDYALLHRNATRMLEAAERLKVKFVICYEDQTIPALVEAKRLDSQDRVAHAAEEIGWLSKYWFKSASYLQLDGKPVLLSFGQTGLSDTEWTECLSKAAVPVAYFSQQQRRQAAIGAFDWPIPSNYKSALQKFRLDSKQWKYAIPVVVPRFVDIYAEAKVGPSYGRIDDANGHQFRSTLEAALATQPAIVQIATWNDWGEGTIIEPSREFGYRDLETLQAVLKPRRPKIGQPSDLQLPLALLKHRRTQPTAAQTQQLNQIASLIADGQMDAARQRLQQFDKK